MATRQLGRIGQKIEANGALQRTVHLVHEDCQGLWVVQPGLGAAAALRVTSTIVPAVVHHPYGLTEFKYLGIRTFPTFF
jgi:hypothetical protein